MNFWEKVQLIWQIRLGDNWILMTISLLEKIKKYIVAALITTFMRVKVQINKIIVCNKILWLIKIKIIWWVTWKIGQMITIIMKINSMKLFMITLILSIEINSTDLMMIYNKIRVFETKIKTLDKTLWRVKDH